MSFFAIYPPESSGGSGSGVIDINGINGSLTFVGAGGISITNVGTTFTFTGSGGGTPAPPDRSVQWNNSGAFGGTQDFVWDVANNLIMDQVTSAGFVGSNGLAFGRVDASGSYIGLNDTSMAFGDLSNSGQIIVGHGSFAHGLVLNADNVGGGIFANGSGSFTHGLVAGSGSMQAAGDASTVFAYVDSGGEAYSNNTAGFVTGAIYSGATMITDGTASWSSGMATGTDDNGHHSQIYSSNNASMARGYAESGGVVQANGLASFALGSSQGSDVDGLISELSANGDGSIAWGYSELGGKIIAESTGSMAGGVNLGAESNIETLADGSLAFGHIDSNCESVSIATNSTGSIAFGSIEATDSEIDTSGAGALAFGFILGSNGSINANADGSVAFGYANGGEIGSNGQGGMAFGFAVSNGTMTTSQSNLVFGTVSNSGSLNGSGQSSMVFGTSDGVGSEIVANDPNNLTFGTANNGGVISGAENGLVFGFSNGIGSRIDGGTNTAICFGIATAGGILGDSLDQASMTFGMADGAGSKIDSNSQSSFAFGNVSTGGQIITNNTSAFAFGETSDLGFINANGGQSLVFGYSNGFGAVISSGGDQSLTFGDAENFSLITGGISSLAYGSSGGPVGFIIVVTSGTFVDGETITGSVSGNTAIISNASRQGSDYITCTNLDGSFNTTDILTGSASGATATLGSIVQNIINAQNSDGGFVSGQVTNGSNIQLNGTASFAHGVADLKSTIVSNDVASVALGYASGFNSSIFAIGEGSFAGGNADGDSSSISTDSQGAFAWGYAGSDGANIQANNQGSFALGYSDGGSSVQANGQGSFSIGAAYNGNSIESDSLGGFAGGSDLAGGIIASGEGSFLWGSNLQDNGNSFATMFGIGLIANTSQSFTVGYSASQLYVDSNGEVLLNSLDGDSEIQLGNSIPVVMVANNGLNVGGTVGTAGQVLTSNGSGASPTWQPAGGGGGTPPASPDRGVQFNNAGAFGATSDFLWDTSENLLLHGVTSSSGSNSIGFGTIGGTASIILNGNSSLGFGNVSAGGDLATGTANLVFGRVGDVVNGNSEIAMTAGNGSLLFGYALNTTATLHGSGSGLLAGGYIANFGNIVGSGQGSLTFGRVIGTSSGSQNTLSATGQGAWAGGFANLHNITSGGAGSLAFGCAINGNILASNTGAVAIGDNLTASGVNSIAFGSGYTNSLGTSFSVGYGAKQLSIDSTGIAEFISGSSTVGFDTSGAWAFSMVGHGVKLAGTEGVLGQVFSSQGSGAIPVWTNALPFVVNSNLTGLTAANASIGSLTPAANHTYSVGGYMTITAISANVISMQVSYTDETSTLRTQTIFTSPVTPAIGAYTFPPIYIRAGTGSAITVFTTVTGAGSQTYDVGCVIQQIG